MFAALAGLGSAVEAVGGFFGNLFGGPPEDKSSIGFDSFVESHQPLPSYPTTKQLIGAGNLAGWPKDQINAISKTYSNVDGTANLGDWKMIVTSVAPITVKWFKGKGEQFTQASQASLNQTATMGPGDPPARENPATAAVFGGGGSSDKTPPGGAETILKWVLIGAGVLLSLVTTIAFLFRRK